MENNWINVKEGLPNFCTHGFASGKHVDIKTKSGEILKVPYQGWGIFGYGDGLDDVTHWRPSTQDDPPDLLPEII